MNENLPVGWVEVELKDVCTKPQYGWTSKAGTVGKIKYLRTTDISSGSFDWETVPYCVEEPNSVEHYQLQKNDILVSRTGAGVGLSYRINEDIDFAAVFASYLIRFKPTGAALPEYIHYFFDCDKYWEQITDFSTGIAVPNISGSKLETLVLPLPPFNEQIRIVAALDGLMNRVSSAQEQLDKLSKIEDRLLRTYITNEDNELLPTVKLGGYCQKGRERIGVDWPGKRLIGVSKDDGITDLRVGTKASFENYKIVHPGDFLYNPMRVDIGSIGIYDGEEIAITSPDYCLSPLLTGQIL